MKILKFFGWTLLSLFVLFLISLITIAIFDYTTDDMEVKALERTIMNMKEDRISIFSAYLQKGYDSSTIEELLVKADDTDLVLLQNGEQADSRQIESLLNSHNLYFSFSKRTPLSFSSEGKVSFMEFSGLYSLSAFRPNDVRKLLLPTDTNWFNSLLSPTPSLQILEFQNGSTELFIINLDNEMNDQMESKEINRSRLSYIKESIITALPKDAHVVIAGNWQNILPGQSLGMENVDAAEIPLEWTKNGWQWVYDPDDSSGYGMLLSDNLQIEEMAFIDHPSENSPKGLKLLLSLK